MSIFFTKCIDLFTFAKYTTYNMKEGSVNQKNNKHESLRLFEDKAVRSVWDEKEEKWFFSVVDIIAILTGSDNPRHYWNVLKRRLKDEGIQLDTICDQLKLMANDGKYYKTDVANTEQVFRIIQSVPSKKAEPFKQWLARVGSERIDQMVDPELSIKQALIDYRRLGYSENWINQRLKSIEIRKDLTDAWDRHGVKKGQEYATLTDIIYQTWAGKTTKEYKEYKNLHKENLRDNMTNEELIMNMLAELSATNITNSRNPQTFKENADCAKSGGGIAKHAREELELATGKKIVSKSNHQELTTKEIPADFTNKVDHPNNIAMIRRMRGLSQAYVAEQIGVSRPKYIDIEKGLKELTVSQVKKLKDLLDVSFNDLLGLETDSFDFSKYIQK